MKEIILEYQKELLSSGITILVLLIVKFISAKTIRRIGAFTDINKVRTRLIIKYVSIGLTGVGVVAITLIWGVNIKDLGLIFSSIFAIIGVALFAQWSILSNVTAGVILFFSFPFRIGDRIRIMDKDIFVKDLDTQEIFLIEDIKAFHLHLRSSKGELFTYPNNLILQKAVAMVSSSESNPDVSKLP